MKIYFTISDFAPSIHMGTPVEIRTYDMEIDDNHLPKEVIRFIENNSNASMMISFNAEGFNINENARN